jgi:ATP-binding protein involved in chromosome partitioning
MASDFEYAAVAIEHTQNPRNLGALDFCDGHARVTGPCGDTMEVWLQVRDRQIRKANFTTDGCGASLACGSMTTQLAMGRTVAEARALGQKDVLDALGGLPEETEHCALLAANTLQAACEDCMSRGRSEGRDESAAAGSCASCGSSSCSAKDRRQNESDQEFADRQALERRLCRIRHKLLVLSGKGGVGKSTVAANLAVSLALAGQRVGLLDIDIHGPSIPGLLGLQGRQISVAGGELVPVRMTDHLAVMSIGFMLSSVKDAVIWRGPLKFNVIRQFLKDVAWGDLDYLVVDSPPGTGDEPLSVAQLVGSPAAAIVVTTPQDLAIADVRRCVSFCEAVSLPVAGIVENMSGLVCPKCGERIDVFKRGGGKALAEETNVPYLGAVPIDPAIVVSGDAGTPFVGTYEQSAAGQAFAEIVRMILAGQEQEPVTTTIKRES